MKLSSYCLVFLLFSCSASNATSSEETAATSIAAVTASAAQPMVLQEVMEQHVFSNRSKPDQFKLQLKGKDVLTGTVNLSIVSAEGETLWNDQFPATYLLDYGFDTYAGDRPTDAQRTAYIQKRMKEFFVDDSFLNQAVKATDKLDTNYTADKKSWEEAKQTGLPGFFYNIGEENGRRLVYSPSQRKAVVVQSCC
ncbi:hypothetical protein [Hymenobacter sp. GOD-10R]|uniref:hypothetical protein n=1 Tax=Hymenobacter sp. GOD-10R TaxID=3093922 RepID=UPI002D790792|nr:hypothetical protein [Hymenobacter sp. GOD-10R]WRQ28855.1 hypothetical protein SD425_01070 [Hymenobacter sp. GOD-10R]